MSKHGWTYKKLGEVATFSRGLTYSKSDVVIESSNKVLRSNNIDLATHSLNFDDVVCLKEEFEIPFDKMLQPNDIFICMSNGSTQHLGKVAFIEKKIDYAFGGFMGAIHPNSDVIFPKFEFYYCLSSEYRRSLASVLNGININNIKWSDLSKFAIPVPPLAEQEWIVAELDLLQGIIEKKKEQLKAYDQLAQSIFYTMFGDPIDNPKGWQVKCFSEIVHSTQLGLIRSAKMQSIDNKYLYFKMNNITSSGQMDLSNITRIDANSEEIEKYQLQKGDFLFNTRNSYELVGKSCVFNGKEKDIVLFNNNLLRIIFKNDTNSVFISYLFNDEYVKKQLNGIKKGTTSVWAVYYKDLAYIKVLAPPLSLQQEFAEKIEAIEQQKALVQASIAETKTLFNSRMDYYFN